MGEYDDMFRPSVDQRLQQAARERADLSAAIDQIATLRAEVERWKAKYIEARQSGYAEGREEATADLRAENERLKGGAGGAVVSDLQSTARELAERLASDCATHWGHVEHIATAIERALAKESATLRAENERLKVELAAYEAQAQSEQTTVLDSWIRRCNELECERSRLDGELREAQATIERLKRELAEWNDADTAEEWLELHAQGFENEGVELARNHAQIIRHQLSYKDELIAEADARTEKAEANLREAQATIERAAQLVAHHIARTQSSIDCLTEEIAKGVAVRQSLESKQARVDVLEVCMKRLREVESALASAKPEPTVIAAKGSINEAEARPGRRLGGGER